MIGAKSGLDSGAAVRSVTEAAPTPVNAVNNGSSLDFAVAATVMAIRPAPRSTGLLKSERRLIGSPRRQPINLCSHNAIEEFGCARRQFERFEYEPLGPQQ